MRSLGLGFQLFIFFGFFTTTGAFAEPLDGSISIETQATTKSCRHANDQFNCVEFVRNYDGDTLTFDIPSVHPLLGNHISIRVSGIDTAEMDAPDSCGYEKAVKAQKAVENMMLKAGEITLQNPKRDKYFRVLADVLVDGKSVAEKLLKKKLAVPYGGGRKPVTDWCNI